MKVHELLEDCEHTTVSAFDVLAQKAPDYAPNDIIFFDLVTQCVEADIDQPRKLLWALASKHHTALRTYCCTGQLSSETLESRAHDAINFASLIVLWNRFENRILRDIYQHWSDVAACECQSPEAWPVCGRCAHLVWFQNHHPASIDSPTAST